MSDKIDKIKIENHSSWPIIRCVQAVAQLMEIEKDLIQQNRKTGCSFLRKDGISIGVLPICPDAPADTLSFCFMDAPDAAKYFTKEENGLVQTWGGANWMNPPYGRKIGDWIRKADEEARKGNLTVALVPARVDTAWWQDYCTKWHYVFLRGRLKFSGSKNSAPFPSALVFFGIER